MPGELGTFLALTGTPFTGEESTGVLGLSDYILNWNKNLEDRLKIISGLADMPITARELYGDDGLKQNVQKWRLLQKNLERQEEEQHADKFSEHKKDIFRPIGSEEPLSAEEINAEIDMKYKHYLRENLYYKALKPNFELGSGATGNYINYYTHFADLYLEHLEFEGCYTSGSFLKHHELQINRCFYGDSIEEIKENLRKEGTKFSKYCLKRMDEMDPLALNVTLALLRKGIRGSYSECCHYEMKAMLNILKQPHKIDKNTPMTPELIESYFSTPEEYKHVDIDVPHHAALPTRFYFRKYPDHLRLMMNEHTSSSEAIRAGYTREVQSQCRELGIDLRDTGVSSQTVRTNLWKVEQAQRRKDYNQRMQGYFLNDERISERFYADVATKIEQLSSGDQWDQEHTDYYSLVNDLVQRSFENALKKNVDMMLEKNQDMHKKFKHRRFLLKLKKFFFENRLLNNPVQQNHIKAQRRQNLPNVPLTFSEDINDNIYSSFKKLNPQTSEDYDKLFANHHNWNDRVNMERERRRQRKRLIMSNGHDPFTESKYWDEYQKMKKLREDMQEEYFNHKHKIEEFDKQYREAKLSQQEYDRNEEILIDSIAQEELEVPELGETKNKDFNELLERAIKNHPEFSLFLDESLNLKEKDPQCVENFKTQFKSLLSKYVQMAVLNHADSRSKKSWNFMPAEPAQSMDFIDSFLTEKVNNNTIGKIMENVSPALNLTMRKIIETEARKILYGLDYQSNVTKALAHVYASQQNPEQIRAKMFVDMMEEQFKDDPEVQTWLKKRPVNVMMGRGLGSPDISIKVRNKVEALTMENPIEALQTYCEAVGFFGYDPTDGDGKVKAEMEENLTKNLGKLENPVDDSIYYGITLLMAHNALEAKSPEQEQDAMECCLKLLGGSKKASYEISQLMKQSADPLEGTLNQANSESLLSDFIDNSCDVESLAEIHKATKSQQSGNDIKRVLEYINDSLAQTSDLRRKNITLKQFFKNDSQINFNFIQNAADTLLREKSKSVAERTVALQEGDIDITSIGLLSDKVKNYLAENIQSEKERIIDRDTLEVFEKPSDIQKDIDAKIRKDLRYAIRMSPDLEFTRARIENELLKAYTFGDKSQTEINDLIHEWVDLRTLDLQSKPQYKYLSDSEFKNLMIEKFRGQVVEEIGLTKFEGNTKKFTEMYEQDERDWGVYKNDLANKNSLNEIMTDAVGYDRIIERLQDPANSGEIAHQNIAEKMLAEYYINKRKDFKASKEMLEALDKEFNAATLNDVAARRGDFVNPDYGYTPASDLEDGLSQFDDKLRQNRKNVEFFSEDLTQLIELGNSVNYAIQGDTQGIAESVLEKVEEGEQEWDTEMHKFDRRRTPKQWVEEKLVKVIEDIFSSRERMEQNPEINAGLTGEVGETISLERHLSRNELKALDNDLVKHFNKDNMIKRLLFELDKEYSEMNQIRTQSKLQKQIDLNQEIQENKHKNEQDLYNRNMKNEDAAYKLIAYRIAKSLHPDKDKPKPDTHFDYWYEKQLQREIMEPPREMDPEDYLPKPKVVKKETDVDESELAYDELEDHLREKDKTNKMNQRVDVRYVLDQYSENEEYRNRANNYTKEFLKQFYDDEKEKDSWFK